MDMMHEQTQQERRPIRLLTYAYQFGRTHSEADGADVKLLCKPHAATTVAYSAWSTALLCSVCDKLVNYLHHAIPLLLV